MHRYPPKLPNETEILHYDPTRTHTLRLREKSHFVGNLGDEALWAHKGQRLRNGLLCTARTRDNTLSTTPIPPCPKDRHGCVKRETHQGRYGRVMTERYIVSPWCPKGRTKRAVRTPVVSGRSLCSRVKTLGTSQLVPEIDQMCKVTSTIDLKVFRSLWTDCVGEQK